MSGDIRFILDFDSTLVRVETLELMADLTPDAAKTRARIREITDAAMGGRMDFQECAPANASQILHIAPRSADPSSRAPAGGDKPFLPA